MNTWLEFITSINHKNTPIDQLPSDKLIHFGSWFRDLPRRDGRTGRDLLSRSIMQSARSNCTSITRWRWRNRYISNDLVPQIIRLKQQKNSAPKRDILELHQYDKFWRFLEYKYQREKNLDDIEKHRRIIFTKFVGVMVNTGMRPKRSSLRSNGKIFLPIRLLIQNSKRRLLLLVSEQRIQKLGEQEILYPPFAEDWKY